jgi:hypothetical protein
VKLIRIVVAGLLGLSAGSAAFAQGANQRQQQGYATTPNGNYVDQRNPVQDPANNGDTAQVTDPYTGLKGPRPANAKDGPQMPNGFGSNRMPKQ